MMDSNLFRSSPDFTSDDPAFPACFPSKTSCIHTTKVLGSRTVKLVCASVAVWKFFRCFGLSQLALISKPNFRPGDIYEDVMAVFKELAIGVLARLTGLAVSVIRNYVAQGLVVLWCNANGHRRYQRTDIWRLSFVLIAQ